MDRGRKHLRSLSAKLASALVVSVLAFQGGLGVVGALYQRADLNQVTSQGADRIADVVRLSVRDAMLRNDRDQLREIMRSIAREPGVVRLRVFDKSGEIDWSTEATEIGAMVDKRAEQCTACHAGDAPFQRLERTDRIRVFRPAGGGPRVMGVIMPVENEPACSAAACHFHPAEQKVLGVLDVQVSLAEADGVFAASLWRTAGGILLSVAAVTVVAVLFVVIWVERPVRALLEGTRRVADGVLDKPIAYDSGGEMAFLARSFNDMTRRLQEAMQVIRHYNETLELKVEEKTRELKSAQEHLLRMERMATIGRLAAIMAHEINNPLAGIRTYAKLLMKRADRAAAAAGGTAADDEGRRHLELIESEAARCGEIVKGLLQFSRKKPLVAEPNDLNTLAEEAMRLVQHRLDLQSVDVRRRYAAGPLSFQCSGQQIVQALLALFINACEAMPGEGVLTVETGAEEGGVWVRVRDSGVGMDAETQARIFEPFFSTKEDAHGVGLGLSVVENIVARHGGRVDLESSPGQGAAFTLHFPPSPPPAAAEDEES